MRSCCGILFALVFCAGLCAGEKLANTYKLDSATQSYQLTLNPNWSFTVTGPDGKQVTGTYVASDRKIGLLAGHLLRHFEYVVKDGDLLLRPSTTDGPEANNVLGQMPPLKRSTSYTAYLTLDHHKQKYSGRPVTSPPVATPPVATPGTPPVNSPVTMDQVTTQALTDSQYHAYMSAGTKSFGEKKYPEARAHFILASRFKPKSSEALEYIALCDGAQALVDGDLARKRGDLDGARQAYTRAKQVCPMLSTIADAQLRTTGVTPPVSSPVTPPVGQPTGALETGVAQHLRQGDTAAALGLATNALRSNPTSQQLRTMKEGLEGLQTAEALNANLKTILERAQKQCDVVQRDEPLGGQTMQWRAQCGNQAKLIDTRTAAARSRYIQNAYAGLGSTVTDARTTATETAHLLDKIREVYANKAAEVAKDDQIDIPFVTIRLDKESKRVKRLNGYADSFKALSAEAAALAK